MDVKVIENVGNGGDLVKTNKDIETIEGLQNMAYIALFGGNPEASTPTERLINEQAFDFWGNSLLHPNNIAAQFNSLTERRLMEVALTSAGRIQIEQAVAKDVEFMSEFATVQIDVKIIGTDRIQIIIFIQEPDNEESKAFKFLWDSTQAELIDAETAIFPPSLGADFNDDFNNDFLT